MKILDFRFSSPEENLACDEALLDSCEEENAGEVLRFWESDTPFVVLGYSSKASEEIDLDSCKKNRIPILRRSSGGGTVLQGRGCLNYALVLKINGPMATITTTNRYVMGKNREALKQVIDRDIRVEGFTDLVLGDLKFSGNSQRRKRHALLFHGTFLLEFDIHSIERYLPFPSRQPGCRQNRQHSDFVTNLHCDAESIKKSMIHAWGADGKAQEPTMRIQKLIAERYSQESWTFKF